MTRRPWEDPRVPLWLRVVLYAQHHRDDGGRVDLRPLQLLWAVDPTGLTQSRHVSRAIRVAERYGALTAESTARRLILAQGWSVQR